MTAGRALTNARPVCISSSSDRRWPAAAFCRSSRSSAAMTMKKERPFRAKQAAMPTVASVRPATTGPRMRERLNWIELSATALGRSRRGTSDGMSD